MGQFLAVGLAHEIVASRKEIKKKNISKEELRQEIEQSMLFDMKLYDETETDNSLIFSLNNQAYERDMIPFLEVFYPIVHRNDHDNEYLELLQKLRTMPFTQWMDLAERKRYCDFQLDEYGEYQYVRFATKDFRPSVRLYLKTLMLYMGYGKISTEGIDNLLIFFKHCIIETFKEHPIAKSMHVYITG
jgi:hypothetical protein